MRAARTDAADRMDSVVALADMERARLEQLAEVLAPVFRDVPEDDDQFDFALSQGLRPRLLIDALAHVSMARDRQTFRFVQDTRRGRAVLGETRDANAMAGRVTDYIAVRIVERRQQVEGTAAPLRPVRDGAAQAGRALQPGMAAPPVSTAEAPAAPPPETAGAGMAGHERARESAWDKAVTAMLWFLIGALAGGALTYAFLNGMFRSLPTFSF
jgi:hypothetical protein